MRKIDVFKREVIITLFLFLSVHFAALAQTVTVTGKVTEPSGATLPGVNIVIAGTTQGTITDIDGNYRIDAPANGRLTFNFVGFSTRNVDINNRSVIDVVLEEDLLRLDEVVVVGYGVQRKSDITGAITSVDVNRLRDVPAASITRALQGKAAGVEIQSTSTRPGGGSMIRIRGNRSLTASNDPLIVVDGIPFSGNLSDIAADDIASIEVLKDASATVIYGSRGANGVIIIETKRGKSGDVQVTYNGYHGVTTVARKYDVYSAEEFVRLREAAGYTNYLMDEREALLTGREVDWQDLIYQNGITANHELGFSGGTETSQYAFSLGFFDESGVLPDMAYNRYNMRAAIDQKLGDRFKVGFTTMNSYAITDGEGANPMWSLVSMSPLARAYNVDGTMKEQPVYDTYETYNPLTLRDHNRWGERRRRVASFNSFYGEVNLMEGLKYRANIGLDFSQDKYNNFYASNTPMRDGAVNQARVQNSDNLSWTIENLLIYDKTINNVHRLNLTGMYSAQENVYTSSRFQAEGIPVDYIQYNNFFLAETVTAHRDNNNYSSWGLISYMGRINYAYRDKYLVTVSGRLDGSSRLTSGNKWHSYPAVALGWNIINEPFMQNLDFVTNLKVRAGYGQTSNTAIDPYRTLGGLTQNKYNFGDQGVRGYYVSTLPNKTLGWEYTTQTNVGIDFAFINGRISGSVDAYLQETNDLLLGKRLPASQGVPGTFIENVGKTENRGLEFVLNGSVIRPSARDGFGWDVSANLFLNRDKIVALQDPSIKQDVGNGWFVGHSQSAIYDYVKLGIWQLDEAVEAAQYGRRPGDIKIKDVNDDGQITPADRQIIGDGVPDFQGGFTNTFYYKGFDFSVVGYYRVGGTIVSTLHMPNDYINRLNGRANGIKVDYWTPQNPANDMPRPDVNFDASYSSTLGYFDGSFLKIRSINLGYDVPKSMIGFLGNSGSVRLYTSVVDPFIFFSPYLDAGGVDPEPNALNASTISGGEGVPQRTPKIGLNTPPTTKFIFGINVKF